MMKLQVQIFGAPKNQYRELQLIFCSLPVTKNVTGKDLITIQDTTKESSEVL